MKRYISRAALCLAFCGSAVATAAPDSYKLQELATGVYAVVREQLPNTPSDSNSLIIVNDSDVVVVDANIFPSSAAQVIAEVKKLTQKPVRYVINTHFHDDHLMGNALYRQTFPGVEIVQHPSTRRLVESEVAPSLKKNLETEYPATIARLRQALATGKRSNGEPLTDDLRARIDADLPAYERFVAEMRSTPAVPGTLTVTDTMTLHRGDRSIVIQHLGAGNTPGDLVVYLPKERILATGDLVVHPIPFAYGSLLSAWPQTLRKLRAFDAVSILPGHGEVQHDWTYVDRLIQLLDSTWEQVAHAVAGGADLKTARTAVHLDTLADAFGGPGRREAFDALFLAPAVEAAYRELQPFAPLAE